MRLMVCGGPSFTNFELVERELTQLSGQRPIAVVIHGWVGPLAARLDRWGQKHNIPISRYFPHGESHSKDADARRSEFLLSDSRPDLVVAFPGDPDASDLVERARQRGIAVLAVCEPSPGTDQAGSPTSTANMNDEADSTSALEAQAGAAAAAQSAQPDKLGFEDRAMVAVLRVYLAVTIALGGYYLMHRSASDASSSEAADAAGVTRAANLVTVAAGSPYRERIQVAAVEQRNEQETREIPALVEADPARVFNILPPLGGRVTDLKVHLGERVDAGQPLVVIDSGDLAQAYSDADKARAQEALTARALQRAKGLNKVGGEGGADKDVESATNDEAQAKAELDRAEARLKTLAGSVNVSDYHYFTVAAPASGTVTQLAISPGSYINDPTQTMLTITNVDSVWVTANVPEKDIGFTSKGQNVDVTFAAYPGETAHGTVLFVNDFTEPDTRRTKVRIAFANPNARYKPNMFANVTFHTPPRQALVAPNSALLMNNDNTSVFVETKPWTFERRTVTTGSDLGGETVITAGLKPGDRIITRGGVLIND